MIVQTDNLNATLSCRRDVNDELCVMQVWSDRGVVPDFAPGQYITLGLPDRQPNGVVGEDVPERPGGLTKRAYSIASPATEHRYLEFLIVRVPDGQLTPQLWDLSVGCRLWVHEKAKGEFTIEDVPPDSDLVMVSTGTGIAPYMSILRTYCGQKRWRRLVMISGVRRSSDLGYHQELEAVASADPTMYYIPIVSREPEGTDWSGLCGHVQDVLEPDTYGLLVGAPLTPERCHVFLCGNPNMIQSVRPSLEDRGFGLHSKRTPGNIHLERYW